MEQLIAIRNKLEKKGLSNYEIDSLLEIVEKEFSKTVCGIVWESQSEDKVEELRDKFPTLERKEGITNSNSYINHILFEGDNLYALTSMQYTHIDEYKDGIVDVIYIDPPYNLCKKDFKYNDTFVNPEDQWKHSKWLSFMNKRLRLAHNLLSKQGVIMISIDEVEVCHLKLLCDEIFGEENRLSTHHVQVRYSNKYTHADKKFYPLMEYVLIYAKNKIHFNPNLPKEEYNVKRFKYKIDELTLGTEMEINNKKVTVFRKGEWKITKAKQGNIGLLKETWVTGSIYSDMSYGKIFQKIVEPRFEIDGLGSLYKVHGLGDDGLGYRYYAGPQKKGATRGRMFSGVPVGRIKEIKQKNAIKHKPIINYYDYSAQFGNIRNEGGVPFNKGKKPIRMLKELINYHPNKNATVLDFFAGSASTAHAVLDLNKEDNGHRQFIMCTNNEVDWDTELEYLIQNKYIGIEPKKNTKKHKNWEKEIETFLSSNEYNRIKSSSNLQKLGICQSITLKRLDNIMNEKNNVLSKCAKYVGNNLIHYKVNLDCEESPIKEITIRRTISKFANYVSIKENCFEVMLDSENYIIYKNNNKVVLIYKNPFACEEVIMDQSRSVLFNYENLRLLVYSTVSQRKMINNIQYIPYPQEIIDKINAAKREVNKL